MTISANSDPESPPARSNIPELSVSELSFAMKRTLEESFGRIRVRGELSGLKLAASGHLYADLKDADSNLNIICWRTTMGRLKITPEDGMEVVCTGKITTYPKSSRYQLIIDSMELAGEGALLKLLEDRKKKLTAEGLFDPARKKAIPFLPHVIGVVTSPTGAVIRDILHRLDDRFPRHVLVWPVIVQGAGAAEQIATAINGFSALPAGGKTPRPDVIIVARGGGSLEDLMAFNEEIVVRAAAECTIPLISAIGHETDTTLIDYAADLRAPTPTGAAELAVPVRRDLRARVMENAQRLYGASTRNLSLLQQRLRSSAAGLGDPRQLLDSKTQSLDHVTHRLSAGFEKYLTSRASQVAHAAAQLRHPRQLLLEAGRTLTIWDQRLIALKFRLLREPEQRLEKWGSLLDAFSYQKVLERGFVVVRDGKGTPLTAATTAKSGQPIELEFHDGRVKGRIDG
ncbi:MAG: exodeoxyribonuclease VII large subunit [Micavibrio sp.]